MPKVTAKAPTRVDLAGGTIDLWPIHQLLDRATTINIGVDLPAEAVVETVSEKNLFILESADQNLKWEGSWQDLATQKILPLLGLFVRARWQPSWGGIKVATSAKSPAGAGLGGSSALSVTIVAALQAMREKYLGQQEKLSQSEIIAIASDVEARIIHAPTGVQDYWGAIRGGLNILHFPPGRVDVQTLPIAKAGDLVQRLVVCYSGQSRASAINNWEIFKRVFDRDVELIKKLQQIADLAYECGQQFAQGNYQEALQASQQEWNARKKLWPNIVTEQTEKLDKAAIGAGATFSRVCGAGGGGVMVIVTAPEKRLAVEAALKNAGGRILSSVLSDQGLKVDS